MARTLAELSSSVDALSFTIETEALRDDTVTAALSKGTSGQGLREAIPETLVIRFGAISEDLAGSLREGDDEGILRSLHDASIKAGTLEEFADRL